MIHAPLPPSLPRQRWGVALLLGWLLAAVLAACSKPPEPTISLYRAIQLGDLNQIQRHLYRGSDVNQPDPAGDYPLHVAAAHGEVVIAETLVDHGAGLEVRDRGGHTPLFVALRAGKTEVAQLLVRRGAERDAEALLFELVRDGLTDRDSLRYLQQFGANVNARNAQGQTPLHIAAARGDLLLCKRLIALGAEINLKDAAGKTALQLANDGGNPYIVDLLKRYGAQGGEEQR